MSAVDTGMQGMLGGRCERELQARGGISDCGVKKSVQTS